jgi:hypothetical protein
MLIMKEITSSKWLKGRPKQIMLLKMSREKLQSLIGCNFKEFGDDSEKEWAVGFFIEPIGQVAIIQYEAYPDVLEVLVENDVDPVSGIKKILAEFQLGEEWVENV